MDFALDTFLLELAAIFPIVNPPGAALVFFGLSATRLTTSGASLLGALRETRSSSLSAR